MFLVSFYNNKNAKSALFFMMKPIWIHKLANIYCNRLQRLRKKTWKISETFKISTTDECSQIRLHWTNNAILVMRNVRFTPFASLPITRQCKLRLRSLPTPIEHQFFFSTFSRSYIRTNIFKIYLNNIGSDAYWLCLKRFHGLESRWT